MATKRMGRPPKKPSDVKGVTLTIRLTSAERKKIEAAAKREGVSVGEWARRMVAEASGSR